MRLKRTYYEVLGVPTTATELEIRRKYHELARKFHPDVAGAKDVASTVFTQINVAYKALTDPDKRAFYDAELKHVAAGRTPRSPVVSEGTPQATVAAAAGPASSAVVAPPTDVAAILRKAQADFHAGHLDVARTGAANVLIADGMNHQAYLLLGDIAMKQKRKEDAVGAYRRVLQIQPTNKLASDRLRHLGVSVPHPPKESPQHRSGKPAEKHSILHRIIRRKD